MTDQDQIILSLRRNDLVRLGKSLRIVRAASMSVGRKGNVKGYLTFAILRCSWTTRPYTVIDVHEARRRGVELVARNVKLKHGLNELLDQDCRRKDAGPNVLKACDIVGILR